MKKITIGIVAFLISVSAHAILAVRTCPTQQHANEILAAYVETHTRAEDNLLIDYLLSCGLNPELPAGWWPQLPEIPPALGGDPVSPS